MAAARRAVRGGVRRGGAGRRDHPGDIGVVASLLLRHTVLEPGEAVFMAAGGLHAYLHGTGVELLANSDNVVRAGLTAKHIDVPELLKLTDPAVAVPVLEPRPLGGGVFGYARPRRSSGCNGSQLGGGEVELPGTGGPRILLCVEGTAVLRAESGGAADDGGLTVGRGESRLLPATDGGAAHGEDLTVGRGESCFLSAADGAVSATGPASRVHRCQRPLTGAARLDGNRQMVAAMITKI